MHLPETPDRGPHTSLVSDVRAAAHCRRSVGGPTVRRVAHNHASKTGRDPSEIGTIERAFRSGMRDGPAERNS